MSFETDFAAAVTSREVAGRLDEHDPLASSRGGFALPEGCIYLDGNSLGPPPRGALERAREVIEIEWGGDLIGAWNGRSWIDLPSRVGHKIARLVGAKPEEVIVADSTSINLAKLLGAALAMRPGRAKIVATPDDFPSDLYMMRAAAESHGRRLVLSTDPRASLDEDTAILVMTHVHYRTGELRDLAALTRAAHAVGALVLFDLAHSAGALPVELNAADVDLAVGCGYKFLNGGPGAPAFLFVAERHHATAANPLPGWLGHAEPFAFAPTYEPAPGVRRFLCGTPPVLSLAALEVGVDSMLAAPIARLREKSMALGNLLLERVRGRCAEFGVEPACPLEAERRGSQVSFRHPAAYAVVQALIERGVIGDFRPPDVMRFGLAPLYLRYVDIWDAAEALREVLATRGWDQPRFARRGVVT